MYKKNVIVKKNKKNMNFLQSQTIYNKETQ
jgi:hypothetical protein